VSDGFFNILINDLLSLVNEEFIKLRLKTITRDNLILFFRDATAGVSILIELKESKKKLLNKRMVKIANSISETHEIPGFILEVE